MADNEMALMAHLLRRAGFGATGEELDRYVAEGYEATVEELLHPERAAQLDDDIVRRYHVDQNVMVSPLSAQTYWLYRMINSLRPLEEKMALFWHGLFATAYFKLDQPKAVIDQSYVFRRHGLGSFHNLLVELSKDPAMIFWLDNKDNHKDAPNENFGRELLELFSMGIGNYTEDDVKACARAFTGWTIRNAEYMSIRASRDSVWPYGHLSWQFEYLPDDHDNSEKTFLGHTGSFNGEDIIDIICHHPATGWFVGSKLYNFFVADTPDEGSIQVLADEFRASKGDIRSVLRTLFLSDFFRSEQIRFAKVKGPVELVVGTARLAGSQRFMEWTAFEMAQNAVYMGQEVINPPTVEGWHTGKEWIDTGTLVERVNAAATEIGDVNHPGVKTIIDRVRARNEELTPGDFVNACLEEVGSLTVSLTTLENLVGHAQAQGNLRFDGPDLTAASGQRVAEMLQLITATREYQML